MQLIDTHCHIHFDALIGDTIGVLERAYDVGVNKMISVGCSLPDSERATEFAGEYDNVWASVGAHPHSSADFLELEDSAAKLLELASRERVVAIGEVGLDYFKNYVPADKQKQTLKMQLEATKSLKLPYIFNIRDAWDEFWQLIDKYPEITGVVHSFSSNKNHLDEALKRGFYIGLNGIMTFTKLDEQLKAARAVPLDKLVLETDAPFLAPQPFRGTTCEPKHIRTIAEFLAELRGEKLEDLAAATTANAERLFKI